MARRPRTIITTTVAPDPEPPAVADDLSMYPPKVQDEIRAGREALVRHAELTTQRGALNAHMEKLAAERKAAAEAARQEAEEDDTEDQPDEITIVTNVNEVAQELGNAAPPQGSDVPVDNSFVPDPAKSAVNPA
jgi:hypothetical protein